MTWGQSYDGWGTLYDIYIGSFWEEPLRYMVNKDLFADEERDLFRDLHDLTRNSTLRKLNDLIKRARLVKV